MVKTKTRVSWYIQLFGKQRFCGILGKEAAALHKQIKDNNMHFEKVAKKEQCKISF